MSPAPTPALAAASLGPAFLELPDIINGTHEDPELGLDIYDAPKISLNLHGVSKVALALTRPPTSAMAAMRLLRLAPASRSEMMDYRTIIIKAKYYQNSNIIQTVLSNIKEIRIIISTLATNPT